MKKNEATATIGAVALGKGLDHAIERRTPSKQYRNFDEVIKDYSNVKKGDVVFFSDSIGSGKVHPVVITKIVDNEPHFTEFGIYNLNSGKLRDRLHAHSHINGKFDSESTKSLSGVYRNPNFDEAAFTKYLEKLPKNLKYNPFKIKQKAMECGGGTCVTFMDDLIRNSSTPGRKGFHFLPEQLAKSLTEVVKPVRNYNRTTSSIGLGLAGYGASKLYNAKKNNDKIVGGSALAAGLVAQAPGIKEVSNFATGALTNATGVTVLRKAEKFIKPETYANLSRFRVKKGIGTALLLGAGALSNYVYNKI